MIHSKNTPCAEFSHSSYLDDALAEDDDYYRSTASSACSSPFPQSDSDPDDSRSGSSSKNTKATDLGLIIANTPEPQLREMMLRLAGKSASLRDAITRELRLSEPTRTPVAVVGGSPRARKNVAKANNTEPRRRLCSRKRSETSPSLSTCFNCGLSFDERRCLDVCFYHPGELEDEVFEFISPTPGPQGRVFKVPTIVSMWSCCEDEPGSVGCTRAPEHVPLRRGEL